MIVCFDLDGVLCSYDIWKSHEHFGKPNYEMVELVKKLHKQGHQLLLSTTRLNPQPFYDRPMDKDVRDGVANQMVTRWLKELQIFDCFKLITGFKPFAHIYVDDKGLCFDGDVGKLEFEIDSRNVEFTKRIKEGID